MSEIDPHVQKLLEDIHTSAKRIVDRLQNETLQGFLSAGSMDLQDIVARRLTIIGEASAALLRKYPEFCEQHQTIPLRQARGMRNFLVHDYDGVDWETMAGHMLRRETRLRPPASLKALARCPGTARTTPWVQGT